MKQLNPEPLSGFKMTELGPFPKEWQVVRIREIVRTGKFALNPRNYKDETFDYYSIPAYQKSNRPVLEKGEKIRSSKLLVEEGTVLFGKLNPRVPKVWLVEASERRKIASTEFIPLFPVKERILSDFLYFLCWSDYIMSRAQELVSGSTPSRQRVDVEAFLQLSIPLPPLPEQRAIAHVLRTVQRAKEATERVIAALKGLKRSLMKHLFTYGPVPLDRADQVPLKGTEIGPVPEHWEVVRLGEVCAFKGGTQPPKREFIYGPRPGYVRLLQIRDFETDEHATYVKQSPRLRMVKPDDVLIARYGASVGKILRGKSGAINVAIVKTLPDESTITKDFLYYRLQGEDFQRFITGLGGRAAQAGFNRAELGSFVTGLPPLPEQREIARILQTVDRKIEAEENRKQALDDLFKTLLHNLMTAKIRVPRTMVERFADHEPG